MKKFIIDKLKDEENLNLIFQYFNDDSYHINHYYIEIIGEAILETTIFKELIHEKILRTEETDLAYIDGVKMEIGKSYFFKYRYGDLMWEKKEVTRFTTNGHPWADGALTDGLWLVDELDDETVLKKFARDWLSRNNVSERTIPEIFVEIYNSYKK